METVILVQKRKTSQQSTTNAKIYYANKQSEEEVQVYEIWGEGAWGEGIRGPSPGQVYLKTNTFFSYLGMNKKIFV